MMLSEQEFTEGDEGYWYENDLQLAAELGKTLLERNKELENQVRQSHHVQYEQAKEIDLLVKQLDVLRNVNESRMRIYEDVDKNLQDLEKSNDRLKGENKADKEKIKLLTANVESAEQRSQELQTKLDKLKDQETLNLKKRDRRTWSVPSLTDAEDTPPTWNKGFATTDDVLNRNRPDDEETRELKNAVRNLKEQLHMEQRKKKDLESEISCLVLENQNLENKISRLEQEGQKIGILEHELQAVEIQSGKICRLCGDKLERSSIMDEPDLKIEHDVDSIPNGEFMRLKNGGSAYGSRESLQNLGLEADDSSPVIASRDVHDIDALQTPSRPNKDPDQDASMSILGELEDQYRRLVRKYEALIEKRTQAKDIGIQEDLETVNVAKRPVSLCLTMDAHNHRKANLDYRSPMDPTEGHFENGPPEYKRLFKEIFDTLRRSVVYEDEVVKSPKSDTSSSETGAIST